MSIQLRLWSPFLRLCRMVVLFTGVIWLFSQVFSGEFLVSATIAGLGGLGAALAGTRPEGPRARIATIAGLAGLAGAALHVYEYYADPPRLGNYYPWFLTAPFAVALLVMVIAAIRPGRDTAS